MTVTVTTPVAGPYTPNGATTQFGFDFKIASASEVAVYQAVGGALVEVSSALYDVALAADGEGGTVTFAAAPAVGSGGIYIYSEPDFSQQTQFSGEGAFNPRSLNGPIDRAALRDIYLKRRLDEIAPTGLLPLDRAGKFLAWDAAGDPLASAGTGADGGLRTDLAATSGSSLVGHLPAGTGAVATTVQDTLRDTIRLWDFLTPAMKSDVRGGSLSVDVSAALQAALDYASGKASDANGSGRAIHVSGGAYLLANPVKFDWRYTSGVIDSGDRRRPTIYGDGNGNTSFFYSGNPASPALYVSGYSSGANGGVDLFFRMRGLRIRRYPLLDRTGVGLRVNQASWIGLEDVLLEGFATNLDLIDCIRGAFTDSQFSGGNVGLRAQASVYSHPNVFSLLRCDFGGNLNNAVYLTKPASWQFLNCSFEGNGTGDATDYVVRVDGGPEEGGVGVAFRGGYFENNWAAADIFLNWSAANNNGTAVIDAVTFNKTSNSRLVTNHVLVSAESPSTGQLRAEISNCGFFSYLYTPNAARPVIAQTTGSNLAFVRSEGNFYQNDVERPQFNGWPAHGDGLSQRVAAAKVAANGSLSNGWNVASVTKVGTGVYRLNYKKAPRTTAIIPQAMLTGNDGRIYLSAENANYAEFTTVNPAGAATDLAFSVEITGELV